MLYMRLEVWALQSDFQGYNQTSAQLTDIIKFFNLRVLFVSPPKQWQCPLGELVYGLVLIYSKCIIQQSAQYGHAQYTVVITKEAWPKIWGQA
jgi:hypothetical protein